MPVTIAIESPMSDDGQALIDGSQRALLAVFPPAEIFSFSPTELATSDVRFFVARDGAKALGCVALVDCGNYGEVKRLFVPAQMRGHGLARALMAQLETHARQSGHTVIRLETGAALVAAVALYTSLGFRTCGCFGDYADHPASLFMEKLL